MTPHPDSRDADRNNNGQISKEAEPKDSVWAYISCLFPERERKAELVPGAVETVRTAQK
jgi:hypothetical protein